MADPSGILGEIIARKRRDVAARLTGRSLADLRSRTVPSVRSLKAALTRPGARFVMEVKRASPSEGKLRPQVDPAETALAYRAAADAISVLVDEPYFGGSYADLEAVRSVFDGPILAKDFIVDPRQVAESRLHGADAVLVMLSVLGDAEARTVMAEAAALGMDALVETHDETEVRRAVALGAELVGINNRNLRTLEVDLATTERLAPLVPGDRIVVSESGIEDRTDVERLARRADAFLVGSSLMKAERPGQVARTLAFGRVKVCGLTSAADAALASAAGATHIGLIIVPGTPRAVKCQEARAILEAAPDAAAVGVFCNERLMKVATSARDLGLDAVQLHGEEDAGYIRGLRNLLPDDIEIWAASGVGDFIPDRPCADRLLFDTAVEGRSGGTGISFDWSRIAGRRELQRCLIAGGITPGNARKAASMGTFAIDLSAGVESAPGRKDPGKLAALFEAVRLPVRGDATCA
jgi:indole-3-glycerol phosphate synthase / phosphoribosylanthranilate isomerase